MCARHADHIGHAGRNHLFSDHRVSYPACIDDWQVQMAPKVPGHGGPLRRLEVMGLNVARISPWTSHDEMQVVDDPERFEIPRDFEPTYTVVAAGFQLLH